MKLNSRDMGDVQILELIGNFDASSANVARQWFEQATAKAPANIIVNLKEVDFMDSTGLSVLVHGMKRSRENQGEVRLCNLQQPVRMIFELTRLDRVFEVFNSEEDAVIAFDEN
jgi:anti-sigma B factor antagonist